jgi:tetratricopeptide (TPR) repeat protein
LAESQAAGYQTLLLRGYHLRGIQLASHDPNQAWLSFMRGLDLHWAGPYRPFQAYHFYAEMALTAENQREWHLAKALMDEAVFHIRKTKNRITTAIVLQMLATDCHMAGQSADALQFLAQAHEIFSSLRASPAVDELVASVQIEQASILCQEGQFASALTSLHSAKPYLSTQSQYRTWFQYYATLGEALQRSGSPDDSERALASAVHISEHLVSSLWDETRSRLLTNPTIFWWGLLLGGDSSRFCGEGGDLLISP